MNLVTENAKSLKKIKKISKKRIIVLSVCLLFYLILALYYGPVTASDSKGYINMISAREPVYPLFLWALRIATGAGYQMAAVLIQSILMALAIDRFVGTLDKIFGLSVVKTVLVLLGFAGVAFICILFTARGVPYSNIILTEGLAMPLWIFFMDFLINGFCTEKMSYIIWGILLSAVMMDIRKQMAVGFIVAFFVLLVGWFKKDGYIKKMLIVTATIIVSVLLAFGLTRIYNYVLRGEFTQNTRDMNLVLTTSLYVSDREDALLIEDPDVKALYLKVSDKLEEDQCTYAFAPKGLTGLQSHYSDSFDKITLGTTANLFVEDAVERGFKEGIDAEMEADRASGVIVKSLLADNIGKYIMVYISSLQEGFVNTVAKRHWLLDIYALIAYIVYISLMIWNALKAKNMKKFWLGFIVLSAIAVNVGVTGALIFCQTRYMIYNMSLFYAALFVMLPDSFNKHTSIL